jgi:hypothetical protein
MRYESYDDVKFSKSAKFSETQYLLVSTGMYWYVQVRKHTSFESCYIRFPTPTSLHSALDLFLVSSCLPQGSILHCQTHPGVYDGFLGGLPLAGRRWQVEKSWGRAYQHSSRGTSSRSSSMQLESEVPAAAPEPGSGQSGKGFQGLQQGWQMNKPVCACIGVYACTVRKISASGAKSALQALQAQNFQAQNPAGQP